MQPGVQAFLSGALTMGVPLILAVRELVVLRRPSGGSGDWRDHRQPSPPPPPRLPPCLLVPPRSPRPIEAAPPRVLEHA